MSKYYIGKLEVLVDAKDNGLFESFAWYLIKSRQLSKKYYVATSINGKTTYLHRLIMLAKKGQTVDHKNKNTRDCRRHNLRIVTGSVNRVNSTVRRNKTGSKYKGVYYKPKRTKPFYALIQSSKKKAIWIGSFKTERQAHIAYERKIKEINVAIETHTKTKKNEI